jgi:hypothetical protein
VLLLLGVWGCASTCKYRTACGRCFLLLYMPLLVALIAAEAAAASVLFTVAGDLSSTDVSDLSRVPGDGTAVADINSFLNTTYVDCCTHVAANGGTRECEWLPSSVQSGCPADTFAAWKHGLVQLLSSNIKIIAGVWIGFLVVQLGAVVSSFLLVRRGKGCRCLCCARRTPGGLSVVSEEDDDPNGGGDAEIGRPGAGRRMGR